MPLVRSRLLRIGDEDHLLLLTFHHFAFDAWSQAVLLRELTAAYQAFADGEASSLSRPQLQYSDFAVWDRSQQRVDGFAEGRRYWRRELADLPTLQLPTDRPRPARPSEAAGQLEFELPRPLVSGLRARAGSEGTTFFTVALAAFQTLLSRYSGQQEIVVGCPVAERNFVELEDLIGNFINTLPLRARMTDGDTFRQLLQRVEQTVLSSLSHRDVPLQLMIQDVLQDRDTTGSPLFQAMFIHEPLAVQPRQLAGVKFALQESPVPATMVDLSLEVNETERGTGGRLNYRFELWERSSIERLVGQFVRLLEAMVADPDQKLSELPLLSESERRQLLVEWNDTAVDYPADRCVHELFEQQVASTPDAVAVVCGDQQLSYRELNQRANQLAHHLRALGVGAETLVGLCLERSAELIIGILGILKAGGAYLPLDADDPPARLEFMLADADVLFLVTQQSLVDGLPVSDCQVVCLDREQAPWRVGRIESRLNITAGNLAYVMYTSGSTGMPKGVAVEHRSIAGWCLATTIRSLLPIVCSYSWPPRRSMPPHWSCGERYCTARNWWSVRSPYRTSGNWKHCCSDIG